MQKNLVKVQLGEIKNSCFVVMPFAPLFEQEYKRVIRPAIEEVGLKCARGDEIYREQPIVMNIWESIRSARVVIAELSGRNPNVMYEVGLAHAIGKPIVLITRNQEDVPVDLKSLRYLYYDTDNPEWGEDLKKELKEMLKNIMECNSPKTYLKDIDVYVEFPATPKEPILNQNGDSLSKSFAGLWHTDWLSIQKNRKHWATLHIPENHGAEFTTYATITYKIGAIQTVVVETLKATLSEGALSLVGISYTYLERGISNSYSIDEFILTKAEPDEALVGKVILKHGERQIRFSKEPITAR